MGAALRRQLAEWSSTLGAQRTLLEAPEYDDDLAAVMGLVAGLLEGQVRASPGGWAAAAPARVAAALPELSPQPEARQARLRAARGCHARKCMCAAAAAAAAQVNPYGERYSLQMVLAGNVDMLRAVFLHYAQVRAGGLGRGVRGVQVACCLCLGPERGRGSCTGRAVCPLLRRPARQQHQPPLARMCSWPAA